MKFCVECGNIYYIKIIDDQMRLVCRRCGHLDEINEKTCVVSGVTTGAANSRNFSDVINKFTKMDPTLPRINTIKCPNIECPQKSPEVIYVRYDEENMKNVYLCCECDTIWE